MWKTLYELKQAPHINSLQISYFTWVLLLLKVTLPCSNTVKDQIEHTFALRRRGITTSRECPICLHEHEDTQHLFQQCPLSLEAWDHRPLHVLVYNTQHMSTKEWIHHCLCKLYNANRFWYYHIHRYSLGHLEITQCASFSPTPTYLRFNCFTVEWKLASPHHFCATTAWPNSKPAWSANPPRLRCCQHRPTHLLPTAYHLTNCRPQT